MSTIVKYEIDYYRKLDKLLEIRKRQMELLRKVDTLAVKNEKKKVM